MKYMFNVEVDGKANAVFDMADEAVRYAMRYVYLSNHHFQEAVDTISQGQVFRYSYGFNGVNIVPVAKRKESSLPMYQAVVADNETLRTQLQAAQAEIAQYEQDAKLFRKLLEYQYWHRQELVRNDDVRRAIRLAPNKYRTCTDVAMKEELK